MKNMSLFSGYIYLFLGIITGIASNGFLKTTEGFSKLNPTIFCVISILVCLFCLSKAMNVIPVGFTYATYGGLTITAVTLFGVFKYNQIPNLYGIIGIALIIVGVYKFNQMPDLYTVVGLALIISGVLIVNLLGKTG